MERSRCGDGLGGCSLMECSATNRRSITDSICVVVMTYIADWQCGIATKVLQEKKSVRLSCCKGVSVAVRFGKSRMGGKVLATTYIAPSNSNKHCPAEVQLSNYKTRLPLPRQSASLICKRDDAQPWRETHVKVAELCRAHRGRYVTVRKRCGVCTYVYMWCG